MSTKIGRPRTIDREVARRLLTGTLVDVKSLAESLGCSTRGLYTVAEELGIDMERRSELNTLRVRMLRLEAAAQQAREEFEVEIDEWNAKNKGEHNNG